MLVELKSIETMLPVHRKQVLTYLKAKDFKLGLLINFGAPLLKDGFERIANVAFKIPSASPRLCVSPSL